MGQDVGRMTSETLAAIEDLNARFETVRKAQDETRARWPDEVWRDGRQAERRGRIAFDQNV